MKPNAIARQRGAVLLMFAAALIMMASWLAYSLIGDLQQKLKRQQAQDVGAALAEAKENLLVFTTIIPELYGVAAEKAGYLLCPDGHALSDASSGYSSGSCSWSSTTNYALGWLPGTNTGSNYFFFSIHAKNGGIPVWYALDDAFEYCDTNCQGNVDMSTITPTMTLDGQPVVAVLIAPGEPLSGTINGAAKTQQRNSNENTYTQWDEYIESMIASKTFVSSRPTNSTVFNDRVIGVTRDELVARLK